VCVKERIEEPRMMISRVGLAVLMGMLAFAPLARAVDDSTKSAARELAKEAKHDFDQGRFAQASRKFQQAFTTTQVPTLALWAARSLVKQGQWVAAAELYRKATQLEKNELWIGNAQEQAQLQASDELEKLRPRVPRLVLQVEGASASEVEITIDEVSMPTSLIGVSRPTDPGERTIKGKHGAESVEQKFVLKEGEQRYVTLKFAPKPNLATSTDSAASNVVAARAEPDTPDLNRVSAPPQNPKNSSKQRAEVSARDTSSNVQSTVGWVSTGIGAAGLVLGTAAGLIVKSRYSDYKSACPNDKCDSTIAQDKLDGYNSWRTLSTAGFIVGGIATAAGVTLLVTSPKHNNRGHIGLFISPSSAELRGAF
jgi:hypothetical protein